MALKEKYPLRHSDDVPLGQDAADLLTFMDMAANTIKMALEKSSGSKRKLSYRKYLQRQEKSSGNFQKPTKKHRTVSSTKGSTKVSQNESLNSLFDITNIRKQDFLQGNETHGQRENDDFSGSSRSNFTLKSRNLPASFFVEPAILQSHKGDYNLCSSSKDDTREDTEVSMESNDFQTSFLQGSTSPLSTNTSLCDGGNPFPLFSPPESPSLPTDTLESILGQVDLQDILNGSKWENCERIIDKTCVTPSMDSRDQIPCHHQPFFSSETQSPSLFSDFTRVSSSSPRSFSDLTSLNTSTPKSCSDSSRDSFLSPLPVSSPTNRCLGNILLPEYNTLHDQYYQRQFLDFHVPLNKFTPNSTDNPDFNAKHDFMHSILKINPSDTIKNHQFNHKPFSLYSRIVPLNPHYSSPHLDRIQLFQQDGRDCSLLDNPMQHHFLGDLASEPVTKSNGSVAFFQERENFGHLPSTTTSLVFVQQHSQSLGKNNDLFPYVQPNCSSFY